MRAAIVFGLAVLALTASGRTTWDMLDSSYTFDKYCSEFGRNYQAGSMEYVTRRGLFETNLRRILAHNNDTTKTWKEGVNQFTDRTPDEFQSLLGYKKSLGFARRGDGVSTPRMSEAQVNDMLRGLPESVDWRTKGAVTPVKNQGNCGSCWTFAAAETLESAWFLKTGKLDVLSEQQFASCTNNPEDCGGTGGCEGGTAEVAYATAITFGGVASEAEYPYMSGGGQDYPCKFTNKTTPPVAHLSSYVTLPSNEAAPLLNAVANIGPIAISVDASSWGNYESGIYNGCSKTNIDLDHAVQLVGYGTDAGVDYWLVRNSWTATWGEAGYIRILRQSPTNPSCGTDYSPQDGSGCNNGPKTITACGTCGILYDNCYPVV